MSGVAVIVLVIVVILLLVFFVPSFGIAARLGAQRRERTSDRQMGMGDQAGGTERPEHRGPVPEQEEREKGTAFPPS